MNEEAYDPDAPAYSVPTTREPDMDKAPPQNENTKWDPHRGVWIWTNNGTNYIWNEFKQIFLPDVDEELIRQQQAAYGATVAEEAKVEEPAATAATPTQPKPEGEAKPKKTKKRKRKDGPEVGDDGKKYVPSKQDNTSLYVQGLPPTITQDDFVNYFGKVGIVKKDSDTGEYKCKIYRDETGRPKGDALVTFLRPESINLAIQLLDDSEISPGYTIKVSEAKFEWKEGTQAKKPKAKKAKKKTFDQASDLSWDEKEQKHVVIKHLFDHSDATQNIHFYDELKEDIEEEIKRSIGPFESVKIFERNPEGVVAVKFATQMLADNCIKVMNGRFFDGRKLSAEFYDGVTNYFVRELDADKDLRDAQWAKYLEEQEAAANAAETASTQ